MSEFQMIFLIQECVRRKEERMKDIIFQKKKKNFDYKISLLYKFFK